MKQKINFTGITLKEMILEEWRLHTELFGGKRFALFPVFLFFLTFGGLYGLELINVSITTIIAVTHVLVLLFGLHTGSVAFIGREAFENLIGEIVFLIYSARSLPVSSSFLLTVFIIKDIIYYSALFILPITLAFIFFTDIITVIILWYSFSLLFLLGISLTLVIAGVNTRSNTVQLFFLTIFTGIGLSIFYFDLFIITIPFGIIEITILVLLVTILSIVGMVIYDFSNKKKKRKSTISYEKVRNYFSFVHPITVKTLIDVQRSSGGVIKVIFSTLIIYVFAILMLLFIQESVGITALTPISFASILALSAFTTYNWITQFDSIEEYIREPFTVQDVYTGKFESFILLTFPTTTLFYILFLPLIQFKLTPVIVGLIVLYSVQFYLYGLTVYITGFSPNEFLFDTVKYALFTLGVGIVLIPLLLAGMVESTQITLVLTILVSIIFGFIGVALYKKKKHSHSDR